MGFIKIEKVSSTDKAKKSGRFIDYNQADNIDNRAFLEAQRLLNKNPQTTQESKTNFADISNIEEKIPQDSSSSKENNHQTSVNRYHDVNNYDGVVDFKQVAYQEKYPSTYQSKISEDQDFITYESPQTNQPIPDEPTDTESSSQPASDMIDDRLKTEKSITKACLSSGLKIFFISLAITILILLGYTFLDKTIEIFPYQSSYNAKEFNESLRRCFILLFLILSFYCSILMLIINNIVTKEFKYHYISKINVYIYETVTIIINALIYIVGGLLTSNIINDLYKQFDLWQKAGTITGSVNIEVINLFKYVITSVIAVFIVINAFSIISIVHKNNKFVFEDV